MSPATPGDPQKGQVDKPTPDEAAEAKQAATAEQTGAQPKPEAAEAKPKRARAKKTEAADVEAEVAQEVGASQPSAEGAEDAGEPSEAAAVEAAASAEAAESKPAAPKRQRARKRATEAPAPKPERSARRGAEPAVLVRAQAKYVRTSARKARLVCDHIRGKDVAEARAILAFTPRGAAKAWSKLLESAIANAENNHELVGEELRIHSVVADEGPTLKRFRPRAMGRATRIRKRTAHLTITLTPKES
jgi:ribosomal protein L22